MAAKCSPDPTVTLMMSAFSHCRRARSGSGRTRQNTDLDDLATRSDRSQRSVIGAGTAEFEDMTGAFAIRRFHQGDIPVRRVAVVDEDRAAERLGTGEFLVRGGYHNRARPQRGGKLKAEQRDAAGSLDQQRVALAHPAARDQAVPGRNAGTGQGRGFNRGEVLRHGDQRGCRQHDILCEHSVHRAATEG